MNASVCGWGACVAGVAAWTVCEAADSRYAAGRLALSALVKKQWQSYHI